MKRCVVLLLSLLCLAAFPALSLSDSSVIIGTDVPAGWYYLPAGCSVSLPDGSESLLPASASFTVPVGEYKVGADLPAGSYSVRCADGVSVVTVSCDNERDLKFLIEILHSDQNEYIGQLILQEGYTVKIRNGSAYFSAPSGIIFD